MPCFQHPGPSCGFAPAILEDPSHGCVSAGPVVHCEVLDFVEAFVQKRLVAEEQSAAADAAVGRSVAAAVAPLASAPPAASSRVMHARIEIARRKAAETMAEYMEKALVATEASRQQSAKQLARLLREAGRKGALL
jgi:hypothetical protein